MRWVKFTEVLLSQTEDGHLKMAKGPRIIEADSVYSVLPGVVPSEVMGPDQTPIGKPAAYICVGVDHILVENTVPEVLYKLTWEGISIERPESTMMKGDYVVTETVKRPIPEIGPGNESKIIS